MYFTSMTRTKKLFLHPQFDSIDMSTKNMEGTCNDQALCDHLNFGMVIGKVPGFQGYLHR